MRCKKDVIQEKREKLRNSYKIKDTNNIKGMILFIVYFYYLIIISILYIL
jgi:hypothetical protein